MENARKSLLDLTMRNRLLNYRLSRGASLEFINTELDELYDTLVGEERPVRFRSVEGTDSGDADVGSGGLVLSTAVEDRSLRTRLRSIRRKAQTFIEEQGYNVLYIALGTLEWYEKSSSDARRAPLILIPVELKRTPIRESYSVVWSGEDPSGNISLAAKLAEQYVALPDFVTDNGAVRVSDYLKEVEAAISSNPKWKVTRSACLNFFSFTKFVMYRDLEPANWLEEENPLLTAILDPDAMTPPDEGIDADDVDELPSRDVYNVVDADPSQIAAILEVKAGRNLVVEGPPGTGKSQTITNLIAELLAAGKTVLFVCEKMAALEVVKSRLDKIGLGDYCLELHSRKANKREFIGELDRTLRLGAPQEVDLEDKFDELDRLKKELNDYARALATPVGAINETPFQLIGQCEHTRDYFRAADRNVPVIHLENVETCTRRELGEADQALRDLALRIRDVTPVLKNPWRECSPTRTLTRLDIDDLLGYFARIRTLIREIDAEAQTIVTRERASEKSFGTGLRAWWTNRRQASLDRRRIERRFSSDMLSPAARFVVDEYLSLCRSPLRLLSGRYLQLRRVFAEWIGELDTRTDEIADARRKIGELLNLPEGLVAEFDAEPIPLTKLREYIDTWESNIETLSSWASYAQVRERCRGTIAAPVIEPMERGEIEPKDAVEAFRGRFSEHLLRVAVLQTPSLANFSADLHESRIQQFRELDERLIEKNRQRLAYELHNRRPTVYRNPSSSSESGVLLREMNKKRRHLPIRSVMKRAGNLIQQIKPCFMMSPLSISQFLDPATMRFDVVIFDEASQVRPEDALGALARGRQAVVMGDTRQLPPTSFFDALMDDDFGEGEDEYDSDSMIATESILHQCRKTFSQRMLTWHYRSKHESLIAVSNREFYDNRLLIYPSTHGVSDALGLKLVHLPDTVYDRGKSARNIDEARVVAEHVFKHFERNPEKSLGVGTFSVAQRDAVFDQIELLRPKHPQLSPLFESEDAEKFFVKNLETIQGDERDVIFVSVGYGFDRDHKITKNFGPLTRDGGERRLNVLMTRARERCVLFSNFRGDELPIDNTEHRGLVGLKAFLKYAETGVLDDRMVSHGDTESPFEESVREFLVANGFEVRTQVGCAGFRIDLAVAHPKASGRYAIGIECDGAMYHSSRSARERDRLRDMILQEYRGWRLHRIWSTDWYNHRANAAERLLAAVHQAIDAPLADAGPSKPESPKQTEAPTAVERDDDETELGAIEDEATPYEVCEDVGIPRLNDTPLHEYDTSSLAYAVRNVVNIEGPVHIEEVTSRIRTFVGVKRTGKRIRAAIEAAMRLADRSGFVEMRGEFLWPLDRAAKLPRLRSGDVVSTKLDHICDEEIVAAVKLVLRLQGKTPPDEVVAQVGRILGLPRMNPENRERVVAIARGEG